MLHSRSSKPFWPALLYLSMILCLRVFFWFSPDHQSKMLSSYLWPTMIAAVSLLVWKCGAELSPPARASLGLSGWLLATTALNKDPYLEYNLAFLFGVAAVFGFCLPLMTLPKARQKGLPLAAGVYGGLMLAVSGMALYYCATGATMRSPFSGAEIYIDTARLYFFSLHPNEFACALAIGCFCWMLLAFQQQKIWKKALCLLGCGVVYLALMLCVCKTTAITVSLMLGAAIYLVLERKLPLDKKVFKITLSLIAAVLVALLSVNALIGKVVSLQAVLRPEETARVTQAELEQRAILQQQGEPTAFADSTYISSVIGQRNFSDSLSTFSLRTEIWKSGFAYLKERPVTLLLGSTDGQVARVPLSSFDRPIYHMHNTWLEVLLLGGIPGFLLLLFVMGYALWAALRLFCLRDSSLWQRFLGLIAPMVLLNQMMEIYPAFSGNAMDMMAMLLIGAVIGVERNLPKRVGRRG